MECVYSHFGNLVTVNTCSHAAGIVGFIISSTAPGKQRFLILPVFRTGDAAEVVAEYFLCVCVLSRLMKH